MPGTIRYPLREPVKENQIYRLIRDKIVDGYWKQGDRLAARRDMEIQLAVSRVTLQRVLQRLMDEGFVESRGPLGTFVTANPPHLTRYALVMPHRPDNNRPWAGYLTALANEASRPRHDQLQIPMFHDDEGRTDSEDHQELLRSVLGRRFAGILFATSPFHLQGSPILDEPGIPRVSLMGSNLSTFGVPTFAFNGEAVIDRVLDRFVQTGRHKIAVVSTTEWFGQMESHLLSAMKNRGISVPEYWMQGVDRRSPQWAGRVVQLLMSARPSDRPDSLFLADDNIVEHASQGLVASRIHRSKLDVIGHCNFPWPPKVHFPINWIGFDIRALLNNGITLLNAQSHGRPEPVVTSINPVFEHEIDKIRASDVNTTITSADSHSPRSHS